MATQNYDLTDTPTNLVASLSLAQGTTYAAQYLGEPGVVSISEAMSAPGIEGPRHFIRNYEVFYITVTSEGVWVWADQEGVLAVTPETS